MRFSLYAKMIYHKYWLTRGAVNKRLYALFIWKVSMKGENKRLNVCKVSKVGHLFNPYTHTYTFAYCHISFSIPLSIFPVLVMKCQNILCHTITYTHTHKMCVYVKSKIKAILKTYQK